MGFDQWRKKFFAQLPQSIERAGLILPHEFRIIDHIGGQYGGKTALQKLVLLRRS